MLNVLSSLICSAEGAGVGGGNVRVIAGSLRPSRGHMSNLHLSDTVLRTDSREKPAETNSRLSG